MTDAVVTANIATRVPTFISCERNDIPCACTVFYNFPFRTFGHCFAISYGYRADVGVCIIGIYSHHIACRLVFELQRVAIGGITFDDEETVLVKLRPRRQDVGAICVVTIFTVTCKCAKFLIPDGVNSTILWREALLSPRGATDSYQQREKEIKFSHIKIN